MRKITAVEFVSLDGVAEAPEAWSAPYFKEEMMEIAQAGMDQADAMLLGRRTYQDFAAYWPQQPHQQAISLLQVGPAILQMWCPREESNLRHTV